MAERERMLSARAGDAPTGRGARPRRLARGLALALIAGLALVGTGCASGSTTARTTTPGAASRLTPTSGVTPAPRATAPTITPIGTAEAQAGASDICDQPKSVATPPPASIPSYPSAELRVSLIQNGSGLFGYCSSAPMGDIASFYTQQLPAKGWGSVHSGSLGGFQQITASQGETQLTLTISPDATQSGVTDILITAQGL
ncbi:MAG: hypothetical protein IVW57_04390 [Ktedonobacterales bacterium]|nr:hypothetical protein [Ktedonobacterales bacterium]